MPYIKPYRLWPQSQPGTVKSKIQRWPLLRIAIAILFLAIVTVPQNLISIFVLDNIPEPLYSWIADIEKTAVFIFLLIVYRLYCRTIEKRPAIEISSHRAILELASGAMLGGGLVASQVALLWLIGSYKIISIGAAEVLLHAAILFGVGAFLQELVIRGIVFRNLEEAFGSWWSLIIISILFGAMHLGNENATIWTSACLTLSDTMLTGAFILTRRIWMVWGIHWAWNFFQDGVFGLPNSGITSFPSWIQPALAGSDWLTGGTFGIEASAIAVGAALAVAVVIFWRAIVCKQIVNRTELHEFRGKNPVS